MVSFPLNSAIFQFGTPTFSAQISLNFAGFSQNVRELSSIPYSQFLEYPRFREIRMKKRCKHLEFMRTSSNVFKTRQAFDSSSDAALADPGLGAFCEPLLNRVAALKVVLPSLN